MTDNIRILAQTFVDLQTKATIEAGNVCSRAQPSEEAAEYLIKTIKAIVECLADDTF